MKNFNRTAEKPEKVSGVRSCRFPSSSDILLLSGCAEKRISRWRDGKWDYTGLELPLNWPLLGCTDMTGDGSGDVVVAGRGEADGITNIYVGYYHHGDPEQWRNIGCIANTGDKNWVVTFCNLTGSPKKNSIVLQEPESGFFGAWVDGTDNWLPLGTGLGKEWHLVCTGDLDGDGKAEIVFFYNNTLYLTGLDKPLTKLEDYGQEWRGELCGDFEGNGKSDLVLRHCWSGEIARVSMDKRWTPMGKLDPEWAVIGVGDYSGKGKNDLLLWQQTTGVFGYLENGDFTCWNQVGVFLSGDGHLTGTSGKVFYV